MSENDNAALLQQIADGRRADVPVPEPDDGASYRDDHDAARRLPLISPPPDGR